MSFLIPLCLVIALAVNQMLPADAARKTAKKKGVSQEVLTEMTTNVNDLTKKIYERELYTPEDAKNLIDLKLKLDEQMDILPDAALAPLYFKVGNIFRMRGDKQDAIICYQTILENFSDTVYGPKSRDILSDMGIEIKLPSKDEEEI